MKAQYTIAVLGSLFLACADDVSLPPLVPATMQPDPIAEQPRALPRLSTASLRARAPTQHERQLGFMTTATPTVVAARVDVLEERPTPRSSVGQDGHVIVTAKRPTYHL